MCAGMNTFIKEHPDCQTYCLISVDANQKRSGNAPLPSLVRQEVRTCKPHNFCRALKPCTYHLNCIAWTTWLSNKSRAPWLIESWTLLVQLCEARRAKVGPLAMNKFFQGKHSNMKGAWLDQNRNRLLNLVSHPENCENPRALCMWGTWYLICVLVVDSLGSNPGAAEQAIGVNEAVWANQSTRDFEGTGATRMDFSVSRHLLALLRSSPIAFFSKPRTAIAAPVGLRDLTEKRWSSSGTCICI